MTKILRPDIQREHPIVKVCIPYYHTWPTPAMVLIEQLVQIGIPGYDVHIFKQETTIIEFARNDLASDPPDMDYDFLFFVDADIGFETAIMTAPNPTGLPIMISHMKQILDHRLNICGGLYVMRKPPHMPNAMRHVEREIYTPILDAPDNGLREVGALGTGFLAIKKKVFDHIRCRNEANVKYWENGRTAIEKLWEKAKESDDSESMAYLKRIKEMFQRSMPKVFPPFWVHYMWDHFKKERRQMGEDIYFCHQARELGFKIYCDFSVQLGHQSIYFATPDKYHDAFEQECIDRHIEEAEKTGFPHQIGKELVKV